MDSAPCWFIWAWLADSTGTTPGITTGTRGTATTPSPVAWQENGIDVSFSRLESEVLLTPPLPLSLSPSLSPAISSEPVSFCASSSSSASSASGSAPALHSYNFLVLDAGQQEQQLPRYRTPSSTTSNNTSTDDNLNTTAQAAFDSFLLCSPSTVSFDAATLEDQSHNLASHGSCSRRRRPSKMPGSTLPAPDELHFANSTYIAAEITANTNGQWRPHTSRSGRSARSASPLFARWARRHHQQLDVHESNDNRSSTDRKSTSSSGNYHHHDPRCLNNDDAIHKHTYNFSTSTVTRSSSSRRQSQSGLPPPLTREEFEALPLAIQRKVRASLPFICHICTLPLPTELALPNWSGVSGH